MRNLLPLFPLPIVAFPKEKLPLHIFENRYKALLEDCELEKMNFGIPTYLNKTMKFGTEMKFLQIVNRYENGSVDVICEGKRVFKINEFHRNMNGKPYSGASVDFVAFKDDATQFQKQTLHKLILQLYELLGVPAPPISPIAIDSFILSHKIGLSIEQEYRLLMLESESERMDFIIKHLEIAIPLVKEINRTQEVIEMNGHFKNFDPLNFEDFNLQ